MKYSDGFWLNKAGYEVKYAEQLYSAEADEYSLTVYAPTQWIHNRGMTLGGPVLTITFSSTMRDSIRVSIEHFRGKCVRGPEFVKFEDPSFRPVISRGDDGSYTLTSGNISVVTGPLGKGWDIKYYYRGRLLTGCGWRSTSIITEDAICHANKLSLSSAERFYARSDNGGDSFIREMLDISVGEYIYGFGEKFTPFIKNGQTVEVWNNDGGTCTEQSYKSVPFFVSSRSYGVFVDHPEKVVFEVASDTVSKTAFTVQGEKLQYYIFGGDNIADVLSRYTDLTGKPPLLPAYSFGLWLSTSFTTSYDEKTVSSFIDGMDKHNIPLEVFHFDCFWMKEFQWCGFQWDKDMFPDPETMIRRLKKRGLKLCVWVNPYIGQRSPVFDMCLDKGYLLRCRDGSVFQCDMWQPGLAVIDFTNPDAREWYAGEIKKLAGMGIDAIKTDFGERIPTDVIYSDGSDPFRMHNYYSYLYNETVYSALRSVYGEGNVCLFARSATAGCQKFPVHWGGDCFSNYASMWETLRGGLSLCMSGFGFFSHDISGFESTGTPDLYKRWTAFGLLSTHSRYHGNSSYRVPWSFDDESCDVTRHFVMLKGRLMPYLYSCAVQTHITGIPMMRALAVDFTGDRTALTVDTQYMLGDSLLVAPVFSENGECTFYLPSGGVWTDIQSGEVLSGGNWYSRKYDYFGLPLFARPDSVIVYGQFSGSVEYDYSDNMHIAVYGIADGHTAETDVFDCKGTPAAHISAVRRGDNVSITVSGTDKPFTAEVPDGLTMTISRQ